MSSLSPPSSKPPPNVEYLADHSLLLAVPAFVPAVLVVGLVVYLAVRDRRLNDADPSPNEPASNMNTSDNNNDDEQEH